ncbi:arsenate reductase family protein [Winogradskyella aurantiaca]|uniref:arsenate reductase family protein n=1 Tax=Winogradskyella aurantiaca TaxID=2219558 RepID=UPI000E1C7C59|nr:ArsC/Spx/MgsR family protein [Winogradskyella aurantiaca]
MKKIYYLSTCDTCKRIMNSVNISEEFHIQDLKSNPISQTDLEKLHEFTGSYESLFNKRSRLYKERGLKDKNLSEMDFKALLLEHYTFLKRPVFIAGDKIFIGNSKSTITALAAELNE